MSKKMVQINVVCNGSTGRIMQQIQEEAIKNGYETYSFFGRGTPTNSNCIKICNKIDVLWSVFLTRLFDKHGYGCKRATKKMIKKIEEIDPDVIQLHNIHGYYLNLEVLFNYLKKCNKKIVWTLHDCWAFTGHCSHFTYPKCDKWKTECKNCERRTEYPKSIFRDNSKNEYKLKQRLFTGIKNLTIVTPSSWLKELVKKSFLNNYEIEVINNGIDLAVFQPKNTINVRQKYNIPNNKKIILGVASVWNSKKGLNDFLELSNYITDEYLIVLIGLTDKQLRNLPQNVIGIKRTENIEELANFYSIAKVLYNPSKEETFSLVTVEAMACGTPVIAYDNSAVKEIINNTENGITISIENEKLENIKIIMEYIKNIETLKNKSYNDYTTKTMAKKYINLYEEREKNE